MRVQAAEGLQVPREDNPREYIGAEPAEITPTNYYIRRIAAGELVEVAGEAQNPTGRGGSSSKSK